jgi:hypothetical protein
MEVRDYLSRMNDILIKKQALLQEISGLTRAQKDALQRENYNELEVLIAKKQTKIDAIDKIDEEFSVYSARLKSTLDIESFDDLPQYRVDGTKELKDNVSEVFRLLSEIKSIEDENTGKMNAEMAKLKGKIKAQNSVKRINRAYGSPAAGTMNHYFDTKK